MKMGPSGPKGAAQVPHKGIKWFGDMQQRWRKGDSYDDSQTMAITHSSGRQTFELRVLVPP